MSVNWETVLADALKLDATQRKQLVARLLTIDGDEQLSESECEGISETVLSRIDGPFIQIESAEDWEAMDARVRARSAEILNSGDGQS